MAGVGVTQVARGAVVHGDEESGEAIVASIAHKMLVEPRDKLGGAHVFAAVYEHLAAQRGLQAGHQERRRNSFAGNISDSDSQVRGAELNEVVVVAADRSRSF